MNGDHNVRLLICAGGTGGGAYPALAALQALKARHADVETLWVGSEAGMEADLVKREGIRYASIPAAGLHGVGLRQLPRNLLQLGRGIGASAQHVREFRPDVLLLTGGYLAAPMAVAARAVPTVLYVPDIEPGLALKFLARFADRIAVTSAESQRYFSKKVVVTGYPVRPGLGGWTRKRARTALKLRDDLPVLLAAGGSKGAHSINQALMAILPALLKLAQVVHITGQGDWDAVAAMSSKLTKLEARRYRPFPYVHEKMGAALAAADMAVMRAGASVLGELPLFGLPAVLVPYPHAWRYQRLNAEHLAAHKAAVIIRDEDLRTELLPVVRKLLLSPRRRKSMHTAMRALARPEAARELAGQLQKLGGQRP
jgi:UDP-N-acetylglucosamine--N-acetylmuramyl-(pentapeptide) pyrophosphoryl-undecaprenol N-acetylglucosamine transferase